MEVAQAEVEVEARVVVVVMVGVGEGTVVEVVTAGAVATMVGAVVEVASGGWVVVVGTEAEVEALRVVVGAATVGEVRKDLEELMVAGVAVAAAVVVVAVVVAVLARMEVVEVEVLVVVVPVAAGATAAWQEASYPCKPLTRQSSSTAQLQPASTSHMLPCQCHCSLP